MKKLEMAKEHHYYMTQVLGVNRAHFATEPVFEVAPQEELAEQSQSLNNIKRFSGASWLVLADSEDVSITDAELDLIEKMLAALGVPESLLNLTLVPCADPILDDFRTELSSYSHILALGENSTALVERFTKDIIPQSLNQFFQQKIVGTYSAAHLLKNPSDKKVTWASMQALMKA